MRKELLQVIDSDLLTENKYYDNIFINNNEIKLNLFEGLN